MKIKDVANQYGLDKDRFERFVINKYPSYLKEGFLSVNFADGADIDLVITEFEKIERQIEENNRKLATEKEIENQRIQQAEKIKKAALANMLITSGFTFDGYTIKKYSGYISGDDAISVDRGWSIFGSSGNTQEKLMASLVIIRRNALAELKEAAYALGCNAVIGVDFDYLTLDPQTANISGGTVYQPYIFGVTANGNAVVIEKNNGANRADQNQKLPDSIDNLPPL